MKKFFMISFVVCIILISSLLVSLTNRYIVEIILLSSDLISRSGYLL